MKTLKQRFIDVGYNSQAAHENALLIEQFKRLEDTGRARIIAEPEVNNYFDVYGEPDDPEEKQDIIDLIEREGIYYVLVQVCCKCCGQWKTVDSIGMIIGNPTDPVNNPYYADLARAAIDAIEKEVQ